MQSAFWNVRLLDDPVELDRRTPFDEVVVVGEDGDNARAELPQDIADFVVCETSDEVAERYPNAAVMPRWLAEQLAPMLLEAASETDDAWLDALRRCARRCYHDRTYVEAFMAVCRMGRRRAIKRFIHETTPTDEWGDDAD